MFGKILIANRGEIAVRIIRACREMGIATVAVHSTADAGAMHVRLADESVCIGPPPATASYLNIPALIAAADISGADAIHPGYGFLSEDSRFAEIVGAHNLVFIGPTPQQIAGMGDKARARRLFGQAGLPLVPGSELPTDCSDAEALARAQEIGFPVLVKATAGGGGIGMCAAGDGEALPAALASTRTIAETVHGDGRVYIEKQLRRPRHIEVQILADRHGNVIHLHERECSLQRRRQKLIEEAPSDALGPRQRRRLADMTVDAIARLGYQGAGTVEFLYQDNDFYFIEMNTRLQVEHPVTEAITGIDLVKAQIRVAAGETLWLKQRDIPLLGKAMEFRINAEDPVTFRPSPGRISLHHPPGGPGVRIDSAIYSGYTVPAHYDSLIAKLTVLGESRSECLDRARSALGEYIIDGIRTTIPLHMRVVAHPDIRRGAYDTLWLEEALARDFPPDGTAPDVP